MSKDKKKEMKAEDFAIGVLVKWKARPTLKNKIGTAVQLAISEIGEVYAIADDRAPWIRFRYTDGGGRTAWTRPVEILPGQEGCTLA